jgi:hypothetical protein
MVMPEYPIGSFMLFQFILFSTHNYKFLFNKTTYNEPLTIVSHEYVFMATKPKPILPVPLSSSFHNRTQGGIIVDAQDIGIVKVHDSLCAGFRNALVREAGRDISFKVRKSVGG